MHQDCLKYSTMSTEESPMKLAELASALAYFESWNSSLQNGVGIHVPARTKLVVQVAYSGK